MRLMMYILAPLLMCGCATTPRATLAMNEPETPVQWALAIHGGTGAVRRDADPERQEMAFAALEEALEAGRAVLAAGGPSLDAVEAAVRSMEDSPAFNAGHGAAVAADGTHELDASIMRGDTLDSGAVTGVRTSRNPVTLARHVMEETPHVFMAWEGADALADDAGVERVPNEYFREPGRYDRWLRTERGQDFLAGREEIEGGTVGAVALDMHGNLAAATSTGGLTNKMSGRIGDSPIIGAGNYANNASCAISCTGRGEEFIRQTVGFRVSALMEFKGMSLQEAMNSVFEESLPSSAGGGVAVDRHGNIVMKYTTRAMNRGAADSSGRFEVAIWD